MKKTIKLGACKGKLIPVLDDYLKFLGIDYEISPDSRKVFYEFEKKDYILDIYILRYDDLIKYSDKFDLMIYGTDQVLEKKNDCNIVLKYFDQKDCHLAVLKNINSNKKEIDKIATNYVNSLSKLSSLDKSKIVNLTGSLEVAPYLDLADYVFDIVVTGNSALENGLCEEKSLLDIGAVLATNSLLKINDFKKLGLISNDNKGIFFAIDGIDGSGKSLLSNLLLNSEINNNPNILIEPFRSEIGKEAFTYFKNEDYSTWVKKMGEINYKYPGFNIISDRSIITCLTDLIRVGYGEGEIKQIISSWQLPQVIFYLDISKEEALRRNRCKTESDEFDTDSEIIKYYDLYKESADFIRDNNLTDICYIDGEQDVQEEINVIKKELKKRR